MTFLNPQLSCHSSASSAFRDLESSLTHATPDSGLTWHTPATPWTALPPQVHPEWQLSHWDERLLGLEQLPLSSCSLKDDLHVLTLEIQQWGHLLIPFLTSVLNVDAIPVTPHHTV